jgi:hypothetical protein
MLIGVEIEFAQYVSGPIACVLDVLIRCVALNLDELTKSIDHIEYNRIVLIDESLPFFLDRGKRGESESFENRLDRLTVFDGGFFLAPSL